MDFNIVHYDEVCPDPIPILFGSVVLTYDHNITTSVYTCNENYVLKGNRTVHCDMEQRKWPIGDIPQCRKLLCQFYIYSLYLNYPIY